MVSNQDRLEAIMKQLHEVRAKIASLDSRIAFRRTAIDDPTMPERHGTEYLRWRQKQKYEIGKFVREKKSLDIYRIQLENDRIAISKEIKAERAAEREARRQKAMETATDETMLIRELYLLIAYVTRKHEVVLSERDQTAIDLARAHLIQSGVFTPK